eukprot:3641990-Rhodomonas_salina.1
MHITACRHKHLRIHLCASRDQLAGLSLACTCPLRGDHGRGSPVSAGSPSPQGVYLVSTDWNVLPLPVFDTAVAISTEVSASAPLAEVRLFKACLSLRSLPCQRELL